MLFLLLFMTLLPAIFICYYICRVLFVRLSRNFFRLVDAAVITHFSQQLLILLQTMFQTDFLSPYAVDESKIIKIPLSQFLINVGLDVGAFVVCFLVWKYILWVPIGKLTIPDPQRTQRNQKILIDKNTSVFKVIRAIKGILKQMIGKGDILIKNYGFEYFTYLMFIRRICLIMAILIITDVCIWIPYCLFFQPLSQFSLVTMPSSGNNDFRTFYTIWVAFIVLYGIYNLKTYLYVLFMYKNFRGENKILNNLKSKTLHMEFISSRFDSITSIKAQMQKYLVQDLEQEDRVLAVQQIPIQSELLEYQYRHSITKIISEYGVDRLSWYWKFFKQETVESIEDQRLQNLEKVRELIQAQRRRNNDIKSCMIIVSRIQTAQKLCQKFEIGKALCNICPDFGYSGGEAMWKVKNENMVVRWAQDPKDLIWINMGYHKKQLFYFAIFNILCGLLLVLSFFFLAITSTDTYIKLPKIIGPAIILILNSTLRFLISKMVEWERKTLRSEWQIKQFKMTAIYFIISVILSSIVRDTLNLIGLLQTGWGWIQLFSLIYKKSDGLFYYIFVLNQTAAQSYTSFVKLGDIFHDCIEPSLWYEKVTRVKRKPKYGRNDTFRLGYSYAINYIVLSVVILYSVSCPLIHFFGLLFFYSKLFLDTYTITVFHQEQICSNMRFIERVIQYVANIVSAWIFLTATSLTFSSNYSNAIILYIFFGISIYYSTSLAKIDSLKDIETDNIINKENIRKDVKDWKDIYQHPFKEEDYVRINQRLNSMRSQ